MFFIYNKIRFNYYIKFTYKKSKNLLENNEKYQEMN